MADVISIYPDANILAGYFLHILDRKKYPNEPSFFNFCAMHEDKIKVVLSSLTLVELTHMLKYGKEFQRYHLSDSHIDGLVSAVPSALEADVIEELDIKEFGKLGKEMIKKHRGMVDCLHVAIAKTNNLMFVTHEGKIGVLKEFYENITTFNHLSKMFS